jgi:hypothetical protein
LKGLGASAGVSSVEIDAQALKVTKLEVCRVNNLEKSGDGLSFDRLDEALPMPIDERALAALKLAPVMEELNRLELRVTGLPSGNYKVLIDGDVAGRVSADDLAKGWNLANASGPITKQARELLKLVFEKNNAFFRRWREVQLFNFPQWVEGPEVEAKRAAEMKREDQHIVELEAQIEKARQPRTHQFELKPEAP